MKPGDIPIFLIGFLFCDVLDTAIKPSSEVKGLIIMADLFLIAFAVALAIERQSRRSK